MGITRRDFIKSAGLAAAVTVAGGLSVRSILENREQASKKCNRSFSICTACGFGCGIEVDNRNGAVVNLQGDRSHLLNGGRLCSGGFTRFPEIASDDYRLKEPLYKKAGSGVWEKLSFEKAVDLIARKTKEIRDQTFLTEWQGRTLNRTEGIAFCLNPVMKNEDLYAWKKLSVILGIAPENHGLNRWHASPFDDLEESLGLGGATNPPEDIAHATTVLVMGSSPVTGSPVLYRFIAEAESNGATIITVDHTLSNSASPGSINAVIRQGTETVFINGIISYALTRKRFNRDFLALHSNAGFLIDELFKADGGRFPGYDPLKGDHDRRNWNFQIDRKGLPRIDRSLDNRYSVFDAMNGFFSRYTPEAVAEITGCEPGYFRQIAHAVSATSLTGSCAVILGRDTVSARSASILQALLGNFGVKGGGIHFAGFAYNDQGYFDMRAGAELLPGGVDFPRFGTDTTIREFEMNRNRFGAGIRQRRNGQTLTSILSALYGQAAAPENEYRLSWLPRKGKAAVQPAALFHFGSDPVPDRTDNLKLYVRMDTVWPDEADSWLTNPAMSDTDIVILPTAHPLEYGGTVTSSHRLVQQTSAVKKIPGKAVPFYEFARSIFSAMQKLYSVEGGVFPEPILSASWKSADADDLTRELVSIGGQEAVLYRGYADSPRGWRWPGDISILYNRSSFSSGGKEFKKGIAPLLWDGAWSGDRPHGIFKPSEARAFPDLDDGVICLFNPKGKEGPLPEYREGNAMTLAESSLVIKKWKADDIVPVMRRTPFVAMGGGSQLIEEVYPGDFCELSRAHAGLLGIESGDPVIVERKGKSVTMRAVIGSRSVPFQSSGVTYKSVTLNCSAKTAHILDLPYPFPAWNDVPLIIKAAKRA